MRLADGAGQKKGQEEETAYRHEIGSFKNDRSFYDEKRQILINKDDKTYVEYDLKVDLKEGETPGFILYRYRWVVLIAFFLTSAATGAVVASISTNRKIIARLDSTLKESHI